MKHPILVITAAIFVSLPLAGAKEKLPEATYANLMIHVDKRTGDIELTFDGKLSVPTSNYSLTVSPRLTKNGKEDTKLSKLPSRIMEGDWYKLSRIRKEKNGAKRINAYDAAYVMPESGFFYSVIIPQKDWTDDVSLVVYTTLRTYSGVTGESVFRFTDLLTLLPGDDEYVPTAKLPPTSRPFVEGINDENREIVAGKADLKTVENYVESHGDGSITIYFEVGNSVINPAFAWNSRTLEELIATINEMRNSNNDPRVVVIGYSSPEGSPGANQRLSMERALSMQRYITDRTKLTISDIAVYEGGINWAGLKRLVASDYTIPDRNEILSILNMPVWNSRTQTGRLTTLMNLNGGDPYRRLLTSYFPQLRGAAFIKVFYNK